MSMGTVISFAPHWPLMYVWWGTGSLVYLMGNIALILRITRHTLKIPERRILQYLWRRSPRTYRSFHYFTTEFTTVLPGEGMSLALERETSFFLILSWLSSVGTALHILFGTMVLSSVLFVSTDDALKIGARILASHLVCRTIVELELAGLRATVKTDYEDEKDQAVV